MTGIDNAPARTDEMVEVNAAALLTGDDEFLEEVPEGESKTHEVLWVSLEDGTRAAVLVHKTATVSADAQLGRGSGPIGMDSVIGNGVILEGAVFTDVEIRDHAHIKPNARVGDIRRATLDRNTHKTALGKIVIEERVIVGSGARIHAPTAGDTTRIEAEAQIGAGARLGVTRDKTILPKAVEIGTKALIARGTVLGTGVVIGAGSEIPEGYEIASNVRIPEGLRFLRGYRQPPSKQRPSRRQIIPKSWLRDLQGFYEEIK